MLTAYAAYRAKQEKSQTRGRKRNPNDPAVVQEFAHKAAAKTWALPSLTFGTTSKLTSTKPRPDLING